jgi:UDP-glucose 4-epimerase
LTVNCWRLTFEEEIMSKNVLVVGGAGYIGSHAVRALAARGYEVTVLDNLSAGHAEALGDHRLIEGDLGDRGLLDRLFSEQAFDCVMHFAALIFVGESEKEPLRYYENNVIKTHALLEAMLAHDIRRFIFSSTAAVYGTPESVPIPEDAPLLPINPYGNTKFMVELLLKDLAKSHGLRYAALRYFNAAGADPAGGIGESHDPENHLIPLVLDAAAGTRDSIAVFGTDYDTPDGTCVRDYIHVNDLVDAHVLALEALDREASLVLNLGNGSGFSVREIIAIAREVTGQDIPTIEKDRRKGDPAQLVANASRAREILGWKPQLNDIRSIIASAWEWHQNRKF